MSSHPQADPQATLDLSKWRKVPNRLIGVGGVLAAIGLIISLAQGNVAQFGYSWLVAYMFCLSICLGALFLVIVHHLFDAGWSVPIRRTCENISTLLCPWMLVFWIPIGVLAFKIYPWWSIDSHTDHALHAKQPLLTWWGFYLVSAICFLVWWRLSNNLRNWSIKQDSTGAAECTYKMRFNSYWGIFAFAVTLTFAAIMWMKALQHQWFSTMYGVYYFAGSVWTTLVTVYLITMALTRMNVLRAVLHRHQFYYLGSLFFAFTVFYAYIAFSQYFIIWNANIPEETFWYSIREQGTWFHVSLVIIFGHFFLPFLSLLRIDVKENFAIMTGFAVWAWLMHYTDMTFNIMPVKHPQGFPFQWFWLDLACIAFMAGILIKAYLVKYASAAPYPLKDPRLIEAMGQDHPIPTPISGGDIDECDHYGDGEMPFTEGK